MKDLLITSSALILAILLIRLLFRRTISRRAQYALWLLVLLRLLVPVNLPAISHNVLSAARPVRETVSAVVERPVSRLPSAAQPLRDGELTAPRPGAAPTEGEGGVKDGEDGIVISDRQGVRPAQVLRAVWYAGMAGMALWLLAANLRFARRLRRTRIPLEGAVIDLRAPSRGRRPRRPVFLSLGRRAAEGGGPYGGPFRFSNNVTFQQFQAPR